MIHILDTDLFTLSELPDSPEYLRLHARTLQLSVDDRMGTTIVTYEEQTRGWLGYVKKSQEMDHQIKAYARLRKHLENYLEWEIFDFDATAASEFQRLQSLRIRVGSSDLKIAAIALSLDATLISRNLLDFRKVPNLRVENWSEP